MTTAINRLQNGTIELTITVPWEDVKKTYEHVVNEFIEELELPGFRKGKAPRNLAVEKLDQNKVYDHILRDIVPQVYSQAVKDEKLTPIISPRIEVIDFGEEKPLQFKALLCEKPKVELGDYKTAIGKLKVEPKIWLPGQEKTEEKPAKISIDKILQAVLESSSVSVPDLLVEDEANRLLSRLIDQTQKLGMTIEQYLLAEGKTSESLKAEYATQARQTLKLEFILDTVADKENIKVTDEQIEKIITETKDPKEKETLKTQKYYLAALLRKQQTLAELDKMAQNLI